jgi:hypothetical protein
VTGPLTTPHFSQFFLNNLASPLRFRLARRSL